MTQKILVIGAGITGVCIAESLRRAGQSVTLIDRVPAGDTAQTSYGNAGLLAREGVGPILDTGIMLQLPKLLLDPNSPVKLRWSYLPRLLPWGLRVLRNGVKDRAHHIVTAMNELIYDTVEQHSTIARGTDAAQYIEKGELTLLYRNKSDFTANKFINDAKKSVGIHWIERDLAQLKERDPALGDAYTFGVAYPDHGWLTDPSAYVSALARHFTQNGGDFLNREVVNIGTDRVTCAGGAEITGDVIILATGAWSKKLAGTFGHNVPLQGERGYHILLKNPSHTPDRPYLVTDNKFGLTPMNAGLRCAGTSEFAPLDAAPSKSPIKLLQKSVRQVYPDLTWDSVETWMGHRPTTIDSLPMLGRTKAAPNVIYAFGGQHLGLTMGPKVAQIIRDIVLDTPTNINLAPYAVDRFD
ncbi:MAG: FAD-binding oxidoreductase [Rhodobacterales bacterium]